MAQLSERETYPTVRERSRAGTMVKWALALVVLSGIGVSTYIVWQRLSRVESTDDAQIDATIVPVSARVGGYVTQVLVGDQQYVKGGDLLVQLDKRDYDVAVARAQANLLKAKLEYIKIKHSEWLMHNAAARQERQLINRGG